MVKTITTILDANKNITTVDKARWIVVRKETNAGRLIWEKWLDGRTTRKT